MFKKMLFIVILICTVCVQPSYTNSCAKPGADFLKLQEVAASEKTETKTAAKQTGLELDVFPLQLINIQL